jgi:putative ABC transport system permease protein
MIWLLLRLAMRNMLRNKRRTILTLFAVISGMASLIVFGGFISYTYWGLREATIHPQLGHIQIYREGYISKGIANPYRYLLCDYQQIEREIQNIARVKTIIGRLGFSGLISNGSNTTTCLATGTMPEREKEIMILNAASMHKRESAGFETLLAGSHLSDSRRHSIVIGNELSRSLNIKTGDMVTILTTTTTGMINAMDIEVSGIVRTSAKEYDRVFVGVPLSVAQTLLNTSCVERIVVFLEKTEETEKIAGDLRRLFKSKGLNLELKTWLELSDFYRAVVRMYNGIFKVVKAIIVTLFLFGIANTMTMSAFERVREIGTLRAIGTKKSGIVKLFLCEGFLLGFVGGVMGVIAGIVTAKIINSLGGFYIPPPPGMSQGYQALIFIEPMVALYAFISTVIIATLSSLYPAWKATNLKIIKALGYV